MSFPLVRSTVAINALQSPKKILQERLKRLGEINRLISIFSIQYIFVEYSPKPFSAKREFHLITHADQKILSRAILCNDLLIEEANTSDTYLDYYQTIFFDFFTSQKLVIHTMRVEKTALTNQKFYFLLKQLVQQGDTFMIDFIFNHPKLINNCSRVQLLDLTLDSMLRGHYSIWCSFLNVFKERGIEEYNELLVELLEDDELYQCPEFFMAIFYKAHDQGKITGEIISICLLKSLRLDANLVVQFLLENINNSLEILRSFILTHNLEFVKKMVPFQPCMQGIEAKDFLELALQALENGDQQIAYALVGGRENLFATIREAYSNSLYSQDIEYEHTLSDFFHKMDLTSDEKWHIAQLKRSILLSRSSLSISVSAGSSFVNFEFIQEEEDVRKCVRSGDLERLRE